MTQLSELTACELLKGYRAGAFTPSDVARAVMRRIKDINPHLHAFIAVDEDSVIAQACAADRQIREGKPQGLLHGIPVAVKDLIDVEGFPTTCGSKILLGNVATRDAFVVERLRAEGAIIVGKLATYEFARGGPNTDTPFQEARNPWNIKHHPGGSSSGAGAAVAGRLIPIAIGTDTGGSVRHPASACGVMGLKPTYGRISRRGVFPLSFSLDHVGILARSAGDVALAMEAVSGFDEADPASAANEQLEFSSSIDLGIAGLRIGFARHLHEEDMTAADETKEALENVSRTLVTLGAEVRDIRLPPLLDIISTKEIIEMSESWAIHRQWLQERPEDYGARARRKLLAGRFLDAADYIGALQRRRELTVEIMKATSDCDVVMTASSMYPACEIEDNVAIQSTYPLHARQLFNLTGQPAMVVMCGQAANGLPLSVQFAARPFREVDLIRFAAAYERATEWHRLSPPMAA